MDEPHAHLSPERMKSLVLRHKYLESLKKYQEAVKRGGFADCQICITRAFKSLSQLKAYSRTVPHLSTLRLRGAFLNAGPNTRPFLFLADVCSPDTMASPSAPLALAHSNHRRRGTCDLASCLPHPLLLRLESMGFLHRFTCRWHPRSRWQTRDTTDICSAPTLHKNAPAPRSLG